MEPYASIPGSTGLKSFQYEPLDLSPNAPSIRLVALQPGTRTQPIRLELIHTKFGQRPQYEALSYTWGSPHPVVPIELNGTQVDVRENLFHALVHLRDETEPRQLWIDYICINQSCLDERNEQVKLMAFIYARAENVIVWLGTSDAELSKKVPRRRYGLKSSFNENYLYENPYWTRLWIVQEIGAAIKLTIHWGWRYVSWDEFFGRANEPDSLARKLYDMRENRYGDGLLLAKLIEVYASSLCEEPRDKVYGLVGIAFDCYDGSLVIDYAKSLFEIYEDVINFTHRSARLDRTEGLSGSSNDSMVTIVHFSRILQQSLGGLSSMCEDFHKIYPGRLAPFIPPDPDEMSKSLNLFRVRGLLTGEVTILGPTIDEIAGNPMSSKRWVTLLAKSDADIMQLRRTSEGFIRVMLKLDKFDLTRVRHISSNVAWNSELEHSALPERPIIEAEKNELDINDLDEPRLFLTGNGYIGLVPSSTRPGDEICQFHNSDTAAILRKEYGRTKIIGSAVVANHSYVEGIKFQIPDLSRVDLETRGTDLYMDLSILQLIAR